MFFYRGLFVVLGLLGLLWWVLSDGDPTSWVIGLPAVSAAGWATVRLGGASAGAVSVPGLLRFTPFFIWESLRGGVDVALRTLAPTMRIQPGFSRFRTELQRRDARVLFVNCVSLLPGTLGADLKGDRLEVHLIDVDMDADTELRRLEKAVARVFPEPL